MAVTITIGGIGAWTVSDTFGGASTTTPTDLEGSRGGSAAASPAEVRLDFDHTRAALLVGGHNVDLGIRFNKSCADNSYDKVRQFFVLHSCKWMGRASLTVREGSQAAILVAISWVDMPNASLAKQYKRLVDKGGTGNVTELSTVSGPYKGVRFNGQYYASGRIGAAVWNAEVQPTGTLPAQVIRKILRESNQ